MTDPELDALFALAADVQRHAHVPYSNFRVGAAIQASDGRRFAGCNVENIAYPQGSCAETGAISAMVASGGSRAIRRIVILGTGPAGPVACAPCGGCRQRILEFATPDTEVWFGPDRAGLRPHRIDALLPGAFHSLTEGPAGDPAATLAPPSPGA
ncbi:cytidine deaminase [Roseomonas sp. BN140053]|uniref:cytidine deaminase n=1 Tax=Roseomonas sp. BN140053 TaxID=3391898 RepID=UPI0039ED448C